MIVVFQDKKLIGVGKELISIFDTDLNELSKLVNLIEMEIATLKNENVTIKNEILTFKKLDIISTKDLEIFEVMKISSIKEELPQSPEEIKQFQELEEAISAIEIEPKTPSIQPEPIEEIPLEIKPKIEPTLPEPEKSLEIEPKEVLEEIKTAPLTEEISLEIRPEEKTIPQKEEKKTSQQLELTIAEAPSIQIEFEDEFEEIKRELSVPIDEFNKKVEEELKKAAQELGIDEKMTFELYKDLLQQIKDEKDVIYRNLNLKNYEELHKSYHKLKGAALNLRLSTIALILKNLDELSKKEEDIKTLEEFTNKLYEFLERKPSQEVKKEVNIPEYVKMLIIQIINDYLENQNELQFHKDKRYIENILNIKIKSIEDLKNLIKGG
jgi:HPt (histidine-containing phosphotransfer) domain-containing protein